MYLGVSEGVVSPPKLYIILNVLITLNKILSRSFLSSAPGSPRPYMAASVTAEGRSVVVVVVCKLKRLEPRARFVQTGG